MSVQWDTGPEEALGDLSDAYIALVQAELVNLANRYAPEIEAWMKINAPWTDRTANARQTLFTDVIEIGQDAVIILLSHGVEYGVFLELAHAGQYAIVGPALDHFIPRIWQDVQRILRT